MHALAQSELRFMNEIYIFFFLDPTSVGNGGESIWGLIEGPEKRFFEAEYLPKIRHSEPGLLSMVSLGDNMIGSQFFFTLGSDQTSLDGVHCVIGQVVEGLEVLRQLNEAICDAEHRPYQDIRISHTVILEDPFENPRGFREPSRSPSPSAERMRGGRIAADEDIDDTGGKTEAEINEMLSEREAKARATILEIVGDLPDADIAPPENVLFVCKLNSVTTDDDLEIIFSRFGKVKGCEVIRDRTTGDSLQYAFVEFDDSKSCEAAYFKMDNVLIDDRRIHVDFSQSVSKVQWRGKGRGLIIKDGSKNNRLDFANYKEPMKRGGNNGNDNNRQRYQKSNDTSRRYNDGRRVILPRRDNRNFDRSRRTSPYSRDRQRTPDRSNRRRSRSKSPLRRQRSRSPQQRQQRSRSPQQRQQRSRSPRQRQQRSRSPRQQQQRLRSPQRYDKNESDRNCRQTNSRIDRRPRSTSRDNSKNRRSSPLMRQRDSKPTKRDSPFTDEKKKMRRNRHRSSSSEGRLHRKDKSSAKKSKKSKKSSKKSKKKNSKKHKKRSSSSSSNSDSDSDTSSDTSSSSSS